MDHPTEGWQGILDNEVAVAVPIQQYCSAHVSGAGSCYIVCHRPWSERPNAGQQRQDGGAISLLTIGGVSQRNAGNVLIFHSTVSRPIHKAANFTKQNTPTNQERHKKMCRSWGLHPRRRTSTHMKRGNPDSINKTCRVPHDELNKPPRIDYNLTTKMITVWTHCT